MTRPHPVGDPVKAFRQTLARARRAENTVRALRAENTALKAAQDQQHQRRQEAGEVTGTASIRAALDGVELRQGQNRP